jgi:uncharacterized protein (TIGR03437 family)
MKKICASISMALLALAAPAIAQPTITDVVNAASRIPTSYPGYGVAQGALFAVVGNGLGPDQLVQASFPLPTTDGLAGITAQIKVGGATVDGILVYASATEVGVILPSSAPTGTGTVTVNNNGATATAPIKVVSSAFGAFSLAYATGLEGAMALPAAAFNLASDGSVMLNNILQSAVPGQPVLLNGTGLGKIASDETESGATDVPSATLHVFVGVQEAQVVSAGRATCCTGLPDGYPVPQGIAAWDVIQFIVPDGIVGCNVNVVVQTGDFISNSVTIAVSPDGSPCTDPTAVDPGETITLSSTARTGSIVLTNITVRSTASGFTTEIGTETGVGLFLQYDVPQPVTVPVYQYGFGSLVGNRDPGTCSVSLYRSILGSVTPNPTPTSPPANPPVMLDAGAAINVTSSKSTKQLNQARPGIYSGSLGNSFSGTGLPPTNNLLLAPGAITADNGGGGVDVGPFKVGLTMPDPPFSFDNIDQLGTITRSQGVTVKWSGGDPNGFVNIIGTTNGLFGTTPGSASIVANFNCSERISAGQFTVPTWVTASMPAPPNTPGSGASLGLSTYVANRVNIPTLDLALFGAVVQIQRSVTLQ